MENEIITPVPQGQRFEAQDNAIGQVKKVGRPTALTDLTVRKLLAAFQRGFTDTKACQYAQIARDTFYRHLREDPAFSDEIQAAKDYWLVLAGDHITNLLLDKSDENVALKVQTSRWIFEKKMPEEYGNKIVQNNNQQNNFYVLNHEQVSDIGKQPDIEKGDPTELLEALEESSVMDARAEEESATPLH